MKATSEIIQSTFDFAIREINALEGRIVVAEDDADAMLWEQARQVVEQLQHVSQRDLAAQWMNARTGKPYSQRHVGYVAQVFEQFTSQTPRPRFRDAYNEIANTPSKLAVHHSSESPEHYTPPAIVDLVADCLGAIDLDPCSNPEKTIPAKRHYTSADDGLGKPWRGRVYMNPPYGDGIEQWVAKLCQEHERADGVSEAIALVPARPDTQWFKCLRNYVCCFVEGRLTFGGNTDPAPFPSAIFYLGEDIGKFYDHFQGIGDIWQRLERGMFAE
jgi:hypothetical protein